jgi:hypothetical protein
MTTSLSHHHDIIVTQRFLDVALPISSVMLVHNGNNRALQRLQGLAPRVHIVALAPHVASSARANLTLDVGWAMATLQFQPKARGCARLEVGG